MTNMKQQVLCKRYGGRGQRGEGIEALTKAKKRGSMRLQQEHANSRSKLEGGG